MKSNLFMNILKWVILFLILCNMPSYMLAYFGSGLGSLTSYSSSLLLLVFYFLANPKHKLIFPFILLGILYFMISSFNFTYLDEKLITREFIRYLILSICSVEILYRTSKQELFYILFIGSLSIILNALVFPEANANFYPSYGRYSGFYLNPNAAGIACLVGYVLTYGIKSTRWKIVGQLAFTLAGVLTFSRTFIIIWLFVTLIAIFKNRKNVVVPFAGAFILILVFTFASNLTLNAERFGALQSLFDNRSGQSSVITADSRTETWAIYTNMIMDKPIIGHGYLKLQTKEYGPGVHNSYLMVLGESGFIPFLLLLGIYGYLIFQSILIFKSNPEYLYITMVIMMALLASHTLFSEFFKIFISMYVYVELRKRRYILNAQIS